VIIKLGLKNFRLNLFDFKILNPRIVNLTRVGLCGSALPTQRTFTSTSNSLTLSYHHSVDVASQTKYLNVTFTYFAVRLAGRYFVTQSVEKQNGRAGKGKGRGEWSG